VIEVVDYDPAWPARVEMLRAEYSEALSAAGVPVVAIEHVRTTALLSTLTKFLSDAERRALLLCAATGCLWCDRGQSPQPTSSRRSGL
jgi:hypothetical protein